MKKLSWLTLQKKNPTFECQKHGQIHGIRKTSVASMLKNEENIQKDFEKFEGRSKESVYFFKILVIGTLLNELTSP